MQLDLHAQDGTRDHLRIGEVSGQAEDASAPDCLLARLPAAVPRTLHLVAGHLADVSRGAPHGVEDAGDVVPAGVDGDAACKALLV